jgi:hypothetical protein
MKQKNLEQKIYSFDNIKLEVERPVSNSDHLDVRDIYIIGKKGKVLIEALTVRKSNGEYVNYIGSDKNEPVKYELSEEVIWGCVRAKRIERYPLLKIDNISFTTKPTKGYIPIKARDLRFFSGEFVGQILDIKPVTQKDLNTADLLSESWKKDQKRKIEARKLPVEVGQEIYLGTELYLSHGEDDFAGGLCKVKKVWKEHGKIWISVAEKDGIYNWTEYLTENQEKWKKEYGTRRGKPDPDLSPESNQWD